MRTTLDEACEQLGIDPKTRRVISSKGRYGVLQGVEYNLNNQGALWILVAGIGGIVRVPRRQFRITKPT